MDSIRMLANDNFDAVSRLSCILLGTNEFFDKLRFAINESLTQRIIFFCQLYELSRDNTEKYILHCLQQAGAQHQIFEPTAIQLIHDASGGSIRLAKHIAAVAMTIASNNESANVTLQHVQQATQLCLLPIPETNR